MSENQDEKHPENNIEGTIKATSELVKAIPVYQDALQPFAKETGKALQTVGKTVNAALAPLRVLVWGMEKIESFISTQLSDKLKNTPLENIKSPDIAVAGPAFESLRYTGENEYLCNLYANLLASSMDLETAKYAHPGFVEIIRNLSTDEARVLNFLYASESAPVIDIRREYKNNLGGVCVKSFVSTIGADSGCEFSDFMGSYLTNLERLGLIVIEKGRTIAEDSAYAQIIEDPSVQSMVKDLNESTEFKAEIVKYYVEMTPFGMQFGQACISNKK